MTWNRGGTLIDEKNNVQLNSKEAVETLQSFQDLVHKEKVMPPNQHASAQQDFIGGKVGMLFMSGSSLAGLNTDIGDKFELCVAYIPAVTESHVPIGGNSLGIFKSTSEQEEASWKLIDFLTNTKNSSQASIDSGYIAIRESSLELPEFKAHLENNPNFKVTIDQLENLYGQAINPADSLIWGGIVKAFEAIEEDANANPQDILDSLQKEVEAYLKDY